MAKVLFLNRTPAAGILSRDPTPTAQMWSRSKPIDGPIIQPTHRLATLYRRASRCCTIAQTARIFLVSPPTIASWMGRLDEEGPDALVRLPEPVNRFPDVDSYLVRPFDQKVDLLGFPALIYED